MQTIDVCSSSEIKITKEFISISNDVNSSVIYLRDIKNFSFDTGGRNQIGIIKLKKIDDEIIEVVARLFDCGLLGRKLFLIFEKIEPLLPYEDSSFYHVDKKIKWFIYFFIMSFLVSLLYILSITNNTSDYFDTILIISSLLGAISLSFVFSFMTKALLNYNVDSDKSNKKSYIARKQWQLQLSFYIYIIFYIFLFFTYNAINSSFVLSSINLYKWIYMIIFIKGIISYFILPFKKFHNFDHKIIIILVLSTFSFYPAIVLSQIINASGGEIRKAIVPSKFLKTKNSFNVLLDFKSLKFGSKKIRISRKMYLELEHLEKVKIDYAYGKLGAPYLLAIENFKYSY